MKRLYFIIAVALMAISSSCGSKGNNGDSDSTLAAYSQYENTPEGSVEAILEAYRRGDAEAYAKLCGDRRGNAFVGADYQKALEIARGYINEMPIMRYMVISSQIEGRQATVKFTVIENSGEESGPRSIGVARGDDGRWRPTIH